MKINSIATIAEAKWLKLQLINYTDSKGIKRKWETAERQNCPGAVVIIPHLIQSDRIILIQQFRPPAAKKILEFPAGLIEQGEDPVQAAIRELKEETGYSGTIKAVYPYSYNSAGMTSEAIMIAIAEIDETAQTDIKTDFDESEDIETIFVKRSELSDFIIKTLNSEQYGVDSKLVAMAIAIKGFKKND